MAIDLIAYAVGLFSPILFVWELLPVKWGKQHFVFSKYVLINASNHNRRYFSYLICNRCTYFCGNCNLLHILKTWGFFFA